MDIGQIHRMPAPVLLCGMCIGMEPCPATVSETVPTMVCAQLSQSQNLSSPNESLGRWNAIV